MTRLGAVIAVSLVVCACIGSGPDTASIESATAAFQSGDLASAEAAFSELERLQPQDPTVLRGLARLRFYDGRVDEADSLLNRARSVSGEDGLSTALRAQIESRRSTDANFRHVLDGGVVVAPFVELDPLPAVEARVNGKPALLVVDTGGPALLLDPEFARSAGVVFSDGGIGTFAGGKQAGILSGTAARFQLARLDCKDLPVTGLPTAGMQLYSGKHVDGVLGMGFLRHFRSTIDYRNKRLVFEPRNAAGSTGETAASVRMWLVGERFVFARARINDAPEGTFFVDTGLAGQGLALTKQALADAHIALDVSRSTQGTGGGGAVTSVPFVAGAVALGSTVRHDVPGVYTPQGSPLGIFPFTAAGLISHEFFKPYAVTFDFSNMRLVLAR